MNNLPKMSSTVSTPELLSGNIGAKTINIKGDDGATFVPSVSTDGVISWTNDKDLPNPEPVNIKGEKGEKGDNGTTNYSELENKPQINGVELSGNKTGEELGLVPDLSGFATKEEIPVVPEALPNPNALTFTGAVNATYDGSQAVSVEIPSGGGGGGTGGGSAEWTLLYDGTITVEEAVIEITENLMVSCEGMVDFIGLITWTANTNTENLNDNIQITVGKVKMGYGRIGDATIAGNALFQATATPGGTYWGRAYSGNSLEYNLGNLQYGFEIPVAQPNYENVDISFFAKTYAGTITLQLYGR